MKMRDRYVVEGTIPKIVIGHRFRVVKATGNVLVSPKWEAEYSYLGKKYHEPLGTNNKATAIRAAHGISQRLERGEERRVRQRIEWKVMRDGYIEYQRHRGRAPKTIEKYEYVLDCFVTFGKERNAHSPSLARLRTSGRSTTP